MGAVTNASYFNEAKGCEMNEEICEESFGAQTSVKKTKCCDTVQELIPGNQNEQQAMSSLEIKNLNLLFTYFLTLLSNLRLLILMLMTLNLLRPWCIPTYRSCIRLS